MKKIIAALVFTAIFLGGCFLTYDYYYGGSDYYTVINDAGEHDTEVSDEGSLKTSIVIHKQPTAPLVTSKRSK